MLTRSFFNFFFLGGDTSSKSLEEGKKGRKEGEEEGEEQEDGEVCYIIDILYTYIVMTIVAI